MSRKITAVIVEWSDGRRYSLKSSYIDMLFRRRNPLSEYLALVFSPELDGSGWIEEDARKQHDAHVQTDPTRRRDEAVS